MIKIEIKLYIDYCIDIYGWNQRYCIQISVIYHLYIIWFMKMYKWFLGYTYVTDVSYGRSATYLSKHIFHYLQKYKGENKLVAQTYDGAAIMFGKHVYKLQILVQSKWKNAIFLHCYAHKLNLR